MQDAGKTVTVEECDFINTYLRNIPKKKDS